MMDADSSMAKTLALLIIRRSQLSEKHDRKDESLLPQNENKALSEHVGMLSLGSAGRCKAHQMWEVGSKKAGS
jgi:hypothetical protein